MKLATFHAALVEKITRFGIRAAARESGFNAMRVSRFCSAKGNMVGRIPMEDWVRLSAVVASLQGRAIEVPLSELDV